MPGSVCIVGHLMLPLLTGSREPWIGGAEVQSLHLAEELHRRGWRLSFLTCARAGDHGDVPTRLGPARLLYERRTQKHLADKVREKRATFAAVRRQAADLFFQRAVWDADVVAAAARLSRRPFVYALASDRDAVALPRWSRRRNVLRWASDVVAQTELQRDWLARYGRSGRVIPSGFPLPPWDAAARRDTVLWVGTLRALKRPQQFLDLAAAVPGERFVLVGGPGEDASLARDLERRAASLPNVEFAGFVPYAAMAPHYARARVLVNTSTYEGFPNTFVLAWLHGAVVLSLGVDPDGLLEQHGLGVVAGDAAALEGELRALLHDEPRRRDIAVRARRHAAGRHDIRRVADAYEEVFEPLLAHSSLARRGGAA